MNTNRTAPPYHPRQQRAGTGTGTLARTPNAQAQRARVLHAPGAYAALLRGADVMAALVRPTLGPLARTVAIAGSTPRAAPEILDSAATITRRTIQIADPFADMGAMLIRQLAWTVFARAGDGSATAVTLAHALLHAAAPAIAAGADRNALRRGIEGGLAVALDALRNGARPVESATMLARTVAGIVREPGLAAIIGEAVESVGPDGAVLIEDWQRTTVAAEYLDGMRGKGGLLSPALLPAGDTVGRLLEPYILVTDCPLDGVNDLLPALEACIAAGGRHLLVVAPEVKSAALALLIVNRARGVLDGVLAVRVPDADARAGVLEDIAVATGGRAFLMAAGDSLAAVTVADLGRARQVWATASTFSILGGYGDKGAIRRRISEAKAALRAVATDDHDTRRGIAERIGKLSGTAAIIYVGAPTDGARAELRVRVTAAVTAAQAALREGAVPGGGGALLSCAPAVNHLADTLQGDEAHGARLLARALSAPARTIAANAGIDTSAIFADTRAGEWGWAFDVLRRCWVDAWDGGILDPLPVVRAALAGSVSTATTIIMTDVLVRHKNPPLAGNP